MKTNVSYLFRRLFGLVLLFTLSACSTTPQVVDHAFSFDATADSPDVEVLDYRYGDSQVPTARNPPQMLALGKSFQGTNIMGPMRRGDSLYVKWRIRSTGEVHEDTVDLRPRLPNDMTHHRIYFIIRGPQLYVYLISPERRPKDAAPIGPAIYSYLKTLAIYP